MPMLFRICLTVSAMIIALPTVALAQTSNTFDGTYAGVSIQNNGSRSCTPTGPVPRPLTVSGGNAQNLMGMGGDVAFTGAVGAQGGAMMRSPKGTVMNLRIDAGGSASGQLTLGACTYQMVWRKK
jgi:hypothetical protein